MTEEEIPDYNIFMMCERLNTNALGELNKDYYFRKCKPSELESWKAFPFDTQKVPTEYEAFMNQYIAATYGDNLDLFFDKTLFVCNRYNKPIATCTSWKAYGKFNTIQWFKTLKAYEGKGIGRALLSKVMKQFEGEDYPVFLHTQPGSFRAIKLYSDFGFYLLKGGQFGTRTNDLEKCLPILEEFIPAKEYKKLKLIDSPSSILKDLENERIIQF
jgi:ribosomal protein S18 acetylase RimI-like enzyme